jgi:hypothetical protein
MTTDPGFAVPSDTDALLGHALANGHAPTAAEDRRQATMPHAARRQQDASRIDVTGRFLIGGACLLLAGLAVAMGVTSFHAQFTYIFATKRQWAPAVLEAVGLDAGAVTFSLLGIALARLGRLAAVERVLVVVCALGSCGMNVLNANLGSPRSVTVYAMPPVLFALTSDRLVAVVRRAALGKAADDAVHRSAWHAAGRSVLHCLRFAVDPSGTGKGIRQAILDATPLPPAPAPAPLSAAPASPASAVVEAIRGGDLTAKAGSSWAAMAAEPGGQPGGSRPRSRRRSRSRRGTKTARFLALVLDRYGPLAEFPLADVYRVSAELAPKVRLHDGSARTALRAAVIAAQDGAE